MKTIINAAYSLFAFIICFACTQKNIYSDAEIINREDFKLTQLLRGETLVFDSLIMKPSQLQVYDSLLITYNQDNSKLFHIFNLNTKKKIGERISMGQGPTEMILPFFVPQKDSIRLFDMMTSTLSTYNIEEFITNPDPIPTSQIKLEIQPLWSELTILGNQLITTTYKPEAPCYLFNEQGALISNIGTYPAVETKLSDLEKTDTYRAILTSNQKDRFAVCHFFTDLIDIYNEKGELLKRLNGPDHFRSQFNEFKQGDRIGSNPVENTYRDAFYSPINTGEDFFVLYNGKFVKQENYNLLAQQLFVFGWDGTPKQFYTLDKGVSRIDIDYKNRKIYGISDQPEYHIIEFSF